MNKILYLISVFSRPNVIKDYFLHKYSCLFGDKFYLNQLFNIYFGHKIDWNNPKSFNEKLNWLKVNDRKPIYNILADKYDVKKFVSDVIGSEYVVPCLGVWNSIDEINFDMLPNQFVIKGTHDSSGAIIVRDKSKLDIQALKKKYEKILNTNYYWRNREWPYKDLRHRVLVDSFLDDHTAGERSISLRDYKFWCFNGEPKYMYCTVKDKNIYENFYDMEFNPVNINHGFSRNVPEFRKPANYEEMINLARILAKASQTKWVRVDFFNVDGKIYFGEFTFYDWGGMRPFITEELDIQLGELIKL